MKTKTFLLLCLFLGIGLNQLSAQSDVYKDVELGWACPVYCDGVPIDLIWGWGYAHLIDHYNSNGEWQWEIISIKGVGWSENTKEEFTFSEQDKIKMSPKLDTYTWECHDNIKGNKGTFYNISGYMIYSEGSGWSDFIVKNATCTGNTK